MCLGLDIELEILECCDVIVLCYDAYTMTTPV